MDFGCERNEDTAVGGGGGGGGVADTVSTLICCCLCPGPVMECESGEDEK